jgi:alpha-L-arabinofuranosidase
MKARVNIKKSGWVFQLGLLAAMFYSLNCPAQVATININNVHTNVMSNTKLLFGITFDSRTSLMGNSSTGLIGYYDSSGVVIPPIDSVFSDFPMSTLRYPGNAIGVGYNWKKAIGSPNLRAHQNLLGNLGSPQPVKFGFDEFMNMTAARGVPSSEIQIMVPIYDSASTGLSLTQSRAAVPNVISHNADWVEYCNSPNDSTNPGGGMDWAAVRAGNGHPDPYGIKIWNIGNEPWSSFEYGSSFDSCNSYLAAVTPIINAMLAIDSTIKITIPTIGNPTSTLSWAYAVLNSTLISSGKVYALSQHYFPSENTSAQSVLAASNALNTLIGVAATKGVKVFVGDYAHYIKSPNATPAQKDSAMQWLAANLEADFLLMLSQKSTIERANFWVYGNAIAEWHPIRKNSPGNYTLMPAAAIYKMLFPAFLDNSLQVTTTSPAASDGRLYAVRSNAFISNDTNYLNVIAVNRDKMNTVPLQVDGVTGYSLNKARLLSATSNTSEEIIETTAGMDIAGNYIMPPMSVLILEYHSPAVGNLIVKLFIEGMYTGNGFMIPNLYNNGLTTNAEATDSLTIELHQPVSPFGVISTQSVVLLRNGYATSTNYPPTGTYYIVVKHRNGLETWSKTPVSFNGSSVFIDFTNP